MSLSARRLSSNVATNRFAWQGNGAPGSAATVEPLLRGAAPSAPAPLVSAMKDLPSPSAERLEAIEREAFDRGYSDGERAGEAAAAVRADAALARLTATIEDIAALRTAVMRRSERDMVRLAVSMAERILRRAVDLDRELLVVMARVAIDRLGEQRTATIHLNPIDYQAVHARRAHDLGKAIELVSDQTIPRGGCLVRSSFGTIDTGIESQVRELSRALLGDDQTDETREGTDGATAGA